MRRLAAFLLLILLGTLSMSPALAAEPSTAFRSRAEQLVGLMNGSTKPDVLFSPAFLAAVPAAQVEAIAKQLTAQFGAAKSVASIEAVTPDQGVVFLAFEKATLKLQMAVASTTPNLIEGLLVVGTEMKDDSADKVIGELRTLPGEVSFLIAALGPEGVTPITALEADRSLAIGSAFKLFILAELSRAVQASEKEWADVVPLGRRSLPSGFLHQWPEDSPLTLHTLAGLMISQSDNSATDALLRAVGREKVEALLPALGVAAPERNRPFLSTLEAFLLKAGSDAALLRDWRAATEAQKRALLAGRIAAASRDSVQSARMTGAPNAIEAVEWFASANDLVRTMNWLRLNGGETARGIMAINAGIPAPDSLAYLGYKGGSEPGVINMTFLLQTKDGDWRAVAGSWNNPAAKLDEARFTSLMSRAVALAAL